MIEHIYAQGIIQYGKTAFAVIICNKYKELFGNRIEQDESDVWFPNQVVKANTKGAFEIISGSTRFFN